MKDFYSKIEHYMGISMLASIAKTELNTIVMKLSKLVNKYYHQLYKLWQQAGTTDNERIKKFKLNLKFLISTPLLALRHSNLRKFFDSTRLIENQKKRLAIIFRRRQTKQHQRHSERGLANPKLTRILTWHKMWQLYQPQVVYQQGMPDLPTRLIPMYDSYPPVPSHKHRSACGRMLNNNFADFKVIIGLTSHVRANAGVVEVPGIRAVMNVVHCTQKS